MSPLDVFRFASSLTGSFCPDHTINLAVAKAVMIGCIKQRKDDEDEDNQDEDHEDEDHEGEDEKTMKTKLKVVQRIWDPLSRPYLEIGTTKKGFIMFDRTFDSFHVDNIDSFVALSRESASIKLFVFVSISMRCGEH
jgi:hypothetical protein